MVFPVFEVYLLNIYFQYCTASENADFVQKKLRNKVTYIIAH